MKKIAIVADNYKLEKFKEQLLKKGFANYTITPFTKETSTIAVRVKQEEVKDIHSICQHVELHFKHSN